MSWVKMSVPGKELTRGRIKHHLKATVPTLIQRKLTVETVAQSLRATFVGVTTSYQSAQPFKAKLASSS